MTSDFDVRVGHKKIDPWTRLASLILAVGLSAHGLEPVRADDLPQGSPKVAETARGESSLFALEAQVTLHRLHDEIVHIADQALPPIKVTARPQLEPDQRIKVLSAESKYENARVAREVAEIAVTEYDLGLFVQDQGVAKGELRLAKLALDRADANVESAKGQLDKIRKASKGSPQDVANEFVAENRVTEAEIARKKKELPIAQAEYRLKFLVDHTKPRRVKELQASLLKARSEELSTQVIWQRETARLKKAQAIDKPRLPSEQELRVIALLKQALLMEEQVRTRLCDGARDSKNGPILPTEIQDLSKPLQDLVTQAKEQQDQVVCGRLKVKVHAAAGQFPIKDGVKDPIEAPPPHPILGPSLKPALAALHDQIVRIADRILPGLESPEALRDDPISQEKMVESAETNYRSAALQVEIAELALNEYEVVAGQQKAESEAELALATSDLVRAPAKSVVARERFAQIKKDSKGSTTDLANEYAFGLGEQLAQQEQELARLRVESARSRVRSLETYGPRQRKMSLMANREEARSVQYAMRATWILEAAKLQKMQTPRPGPPARDRRILALLDRAIPLEEQVRARLGEIARKGKASEPLPTEIRDLCAQLRSLVIQAQSLDDEAQTEQWKQRVQYVSSAE